MRSVVNHVVVGAVALLLPSGPVMAQTNQTDAARWLAGAELAPDFHIPSSIDDWQSRRAQIRAQTLEALGRLPARPRLPAVKILASEERDDVRIEKFEFDNLAG